MASQSMALVGVWKLIPFFMVFACVKRVTVLNRPGLLKRRLLPLLYPIGPIFRSQGIGGSSQSRHNRVITSLDSGER